MVGCVRRIPWRFVAPMLVLCGIIAAMVPLARAGRRAAWRAQRANNLKQIGLALRNYNDINGGLPPAVIRDSGGRLTSSWRLRIMPFVEATNILMWSTKPSWSAPESFAWVVRACPAFAFCGGDDPRLRSEANVVAITGPDTAFDGDHQCSVADLPPATILAIDIKDSGVFWAEPGDLDIGNVPQSITAGIDGDGVHVLFADGTVWYVHKAVPLDDLKKFFTVDGARRFDREQVLGPYAYRYADR
jgi:hypothetical protein